MFTRILLSILILVISAVPSFADMICNWAFDGDIANRVENLKLEPTIHGTIDFTEGVRGKALKLDAAQQDALIIPNSNGLNDLAKFSVSLWVQLDPQEKNSYAVFISLGGEGNQGWQIRAHRDYGFAGFTFRGTDGSAASGYGGGLVNDGNWHHVAVVYDEQFVTLYVDGRFAEVKDAPAGGIGKAESPLVIGAKIVHGKTEPSRYFDGAIDEIQIFDHALNLQEIDELSDRDKHLRAKLTQMYRDYGISHNAVHRGAGKNRPENTLQAFAYAWQRKLVPEGDIRSTKDGHIVFFHDNDLLRTAPSAPQAWKKKVISDLTLAELKTLDVGAFRGAPGQRIPTIEEVFEVMSKDPSKFIFLDYKTIDMERLAALVRAYEIGKQVIFTTHNYDLICRWRQLVPESQTKIWMGESQEAIGRKLDYLRTYDFKGIYILQMHYKPVGDGFQLADEFILSVRDELLQKGIIVQVFPWEIADPAVYKRLIQLGYDAFGTDYPDVLLPLYNKSH